LHASHFIETDKSYVWTPCKLDVIINENEPRYKKTFSEGPSYSLTVHVINISCVVHLHKIIDPCVLMSLHRVKNDRREGN